MGPAERAQCSRWLARKLDGRVEAEGVALGSPGGSLQGKRATEARRTADRLNAVQRDRQIDERSSP